MDLLTATLAWQIALLAMLIFGFAPGAVLRVLVRAWPRDDERRRELVSELKGVPYVDRPIWVAEQIESALFDGLPARYRARRSRRGKRRRSRLDGVPAPHPLPESVLWTGPTLYGLEEEVAGLVRIVADRDEASNRLQTVLDLIPSLPAEDALSIAGISTDTLRGLIGEADQLSDAQLRQAGLERRSLLDLTAALDMIGNGTSV